MTTGFAAIGAGMIALIGSALPIFSRGDAETLSMMIGVTSIGLGIGFWNAATLMRDLVNEADKAAKQAM